jgi:GNAT superfamily N-acetyltransferase
MRDGWNLYAGYFMPFDLDPYGLYKIDFHLGLAQESANQGHGIGPRLSAQFILKYDPTEFCYCKELYWTQLAWTMELWFVEQVGFGWAPSSGYKTIGDTNWHIDSSEKYPHQKPPEQVGDDMWLEMVDSPGVSASDIWVEGTFRDKFLVSLAQGFKTTLRCVGWSGDKIDIQTIEWGHSWSRANMSPTGAITYNYYPK